MAACGQVRDPKVAVTERVWMLAGDTAAITLTARRGRLGADRLVGAVRHNQPLHQSSSDRQPEVADCPFRPARVEQNRAP
jgi:hypothetical protein